MENFRNLTLVGTSHIASESIRAVNAAITDKVDIVAVELDNNRLQALLSSKRRRPSLSDIRIVGLTGWLFAIIGGWVQKKLGASVGIDPGADMLAAVKACRKKGKTLALIDQDISVTLRRLSTSLTWKERLRVPYDIIAAILAPRRQIKKLGITSLDLSKVPSKELIKKLILEVKHRYPNIYRVLIEERNIFMSHRLVRLMESNRDKIIIAVVGAGHEEEMIGMIRSLLNDDDSSAQSFEFSASLG
ncbi:MAG TPA: TraB/GumN family protein [Candidatus Nanoarchaeia archaeon]|nr:TraB/GumN family protein [Candidatus Nanoarchaeia archaeon]